MADYIGTIQSTCEDEQYHLGVGNCEKKEGKTVGLILTAVNSTYSADSQIFQSELDKYLMSDGLNRMTILSGIKGNAPSGGELNTVDDGTYGEQVTIGLTAKTFVFDVAGGDCRFKELSKLNGKDFRVFRVDDGGYIYGVAKKSSDKINFIGFKASMYVYKTHSDGSNRFGIKVSVSFSADNENEERNLHAFSIGDMPEGLIGVHLNAGVIAGTAIVVTSCSGDDITPIYGSDWAISMFTKKGSGATPTSVTFDEDTGSLTIVPAGEYKVAKASVLSAGNVIGYEGDGIVTTI